jgi:pimeloyl-ACP methyl ester carboxylesterase
MEVAGFSLSKATLAALSLVDLTKLHDRPAAEMLVIDGSALPVSRAWSETMSRLGAKIQYHALPGMIEMLMTAPQFAKVPHEMIEAMCDWIPSVSRPIPVAAARRDAQPDLPSAVLRMEIQPQPDSACASNGRISEQPVVFGTNGLLFGILTEPPQGERRHRAVILLNAGADYHIGASGMYVALARRWAHSGYFVLRFDLAGLGDSLTRQGRSDEEVFPPAAMDDVRAAIDLVRNRHGVRDVTLAGLCSGAYHALRAAVSGLPVHRILMINPQNYFWKETMTVNDMQVAELVRNPGLYRAQMLSSSAWKKLFTGQANIRYISKIFGNRLLLAFESKARDIARRFRIHLPDDLGWELERVAARGVRVIFVFAPGEPGMDLLRIQAGSSIRRIGTNCRVLTVPAGDHVFSKKGSRVLLDRVLDAELFVRNPLDAAMPLVAELKHGA